MILQYLKKKSNPLLSCALKTIDLVKNCGFFCLAYLELLIHVSASNDIKPRVENKQKISNRPEKENENKGYENLAFGLKLIRRIRAESMIG